MLVGHSSFACFSKHFGFRLELFTELAVSRLSLGEFCFEAWEHPRHDPKPGASIASTASVSNNSNNPPHLTLKGSGEKSTHHIYIITLVLYILHLSSIRILSCCIHEESCTPAQCQGLFSQLEDVEELMIDRQLFGSVSSFDMSEDGYMSCISASAMFKALLLPPPDANKTVLSLALRTIKVTEMRVHTDEQRDWTVSRERKVWVSVPQLKEFLRAAVSQRDRRGMGLRLELVRCETDRGQVISRSLCMG